MLLQKKNVNKILLVYGQLKRLHEAIGLKTHGKKAMYVKSENQNRILGDSKMGTGNRWGGRDLRLSPHRNMEATIC